MALTRCALNKLFRSSFSIKPALPLAVQSLLSSTPFYQCTVPSAAYSTLRSDDVRSSLSDDSATAQVNNILLSDLSDVKAPVAAPALTQNLAVYNSIIAPNIDNQKRFQILPAGIQHFAAVIDKSTEPKIFIIKEIISQLVTRQESHRIIIYAAHRAESGALTQPINQYIQEIMHQKPNIDIKISSLTTAAFQLVIREKKDNLIWDNTAVEDIPATLIHPKFLYDVNKIIARLNSVKNVQRSILLYNYEFHASVGLLSDFLAVDIHLFALPTDNYSMLSANRNYETIAILSRNQQTKVNKTYVIDRLGYLWHRNSLDARKVVIHRLSYFSKGVYVEIDRSNAKALKSLVNRTENRLLCQDIVLNVQSLDLSIFDWNKSKAAKELQSEWSVDYYKILQLRKNQTKAALPIVDKDPIKQDLA
jgi:hypothetical protein